MAGAGELEAAFRGLPAALQALQDRAVAEAVRQAEARLDQHYALYHRSAGGGGGNWVLLEDRVLAATAFSLNFPSLPADYRDLRFVVDGRVSSSSVASGPITLQLNGDTGNNYRSLLHYVQLTPGDVHSVTGPGAGGAGSTHYFAWVGAVPGELATDSGSTGVLDLTLYHYTLTDRYKRFWAQSTLTGAHTDGAQTRHASGEWRGTAAVNRVVFTGPGVWVVGTRARVYGWTDGA